MSLQLVTIDLDETLLRRDKSYDRQRFMAVKDALMEMGVLVCIATGNSYHKVVDFFNEEERQGLYFATDNGNYIIHDEDTLHTIGIDRENAIAISKHIQAIPGYHPLVSTGEVSYFNTKQAFAVEMFNKYNNNLVQLEDFEELPQDLQVTKIAIVSEYELEANKKVTTGIQESFEHIQAVTSGNIWMDVISDQGGKGAAVKYLEENFHIDTQSAMAFGDSLNDYTMMQAVHYSVAMGNADPELAEVCRYQIGSNQDQAVIDTLERYVQEGSLSFMEAYRK